MCEESNLERRLASIGFNREQLARITGSRVVVYINTTEVEGVVTQLVLFGYSLGDALALCCGYAGLLNSRAATIADKLQNLSALVIDKPLLLALIQRQPMLLGKSMAECRAIFSIIKSLEWNVMGRANIFLFSAKEIRRRMKVLASAGRSIAAEPHLLSADKKRFDDLFPRTT